MAKKDDLKRLSKEDLVRLASSGTASTAGRNYSKVRDMARQAQQPLAVAFTALAGFGVGAGQRELDERSNTVLEFAGRTFKPSAGVALVAKITEGFVGDPLTMQGQTIKSLADAAMGGAGYAHGFGLLTGDQQE